MMLPIIETERLILRTPRALDAEHIALYLNDFGVAGNLARIPFPYSLGEAKAWLRTRHPDVEPDDANFSIEVKGTGYAGHIGFHPGPEGPVIGYWLGRPFWARGYMTEAAAACLDWFFDTTGTPAVYSGVFQFNTASLAVQSKLGFVETGRSWLLCLARDAEVEHIDTQLTLGVWKAGRS